MRDDSAEILYQSFLQEALEQFWHGQRRQLTAVFHPAVPLPTTASSTLQGALADGFGEAVGVRDMPEPF